MLLSLQMKMKKKSAVDNGTATRQTRRQRGDSLDESVDKRRVGSLNPRKSFSLNRISSHASGLSRVSSQFSVEYSKVDTTGKKKKPMKEHPYEKLFGKRVSSHLSEHKHPDEIGISWEEYKTNKWPNNLPDFIGDLILYISGFDIAQFI